MEENLKFLDTVLEMIRQRLNQLQGRIAEGEKEIEAMHEYYWENYTEMDEYGYENFDNQQALLNQINANAQQHSLHTRYKKMLNSPYFGRVDFIYDGEEEPESFYIGIGTFSPQKGSVPLIYDWRAPVSSLFYDYDSGKASYEAPQGEMGGEITSKWQYKIRRGRLVYAFESDVKIDDEILREELSGSGDTRMKNIIRTIQKEQNEIIRNTKDRILVIQGVAGSGKTSVALHRIAYLLYHDRNNLRSENVLILSPNSVFSDYISHVLPELGEEPIREMSLDTFAYRRLNDTVNDCEDRYDRLERLLAGGDDGSFQEKQSREFMDNLYGYAMQLEAELMDFVPVSIRGFKRSEGEIQNLFYEKFTEYPLLRRMDAVREYYVDEYETLTGKELSQEENDRLRLQFDAMYDTKDIYILYSRFLETMGYKPLPHRKYEQRKLAYEDVYPMLYLKLILSGSGKDASIHHLVIDEMQDYTYLQYEILGLLFNCPMTILGDKAQTMDTRQQDVTTFLPSILGRGIRMIKMNKSYRNTQPIAAYAAALTGLGDLELFAREGEEVNCRTFGCRQDTLRHIAKAFAAYADSTETAAALFLTEAEAKAAYTMLLTLFDGLGISRDLLSYVDRNSSRFSPGLTVTTFYLAKGLEFETVFSVTDKERRDTLTDQARYIMATRAMHRLYVCEDDGSGEKEPLRELSFAGMATENRQDNTARNA